MIGSRNYMILFFYLFSYVIGSQYKYCRAINPFNKLFN